jgi:two-component system, NarL family, invasion response regulator UvrY
MHRILIADDHPIIQNGLTFLLKDHFTNVSIDGAYNGEQIFTLLKNQVYDLIILDINMPQMSFSDFELIRDQYPNQKILLFSQHPEEHFAIRHLKRGASGFLNKSVNDEQIITVIKSVLNGNKYFSSVVMEQMINQVNGKGAENPLEQLSGREYEIVILITKGLSVTEISHQMHLSLSAVSTYKNRAMQKLNVKTLVGLIELSKQFLS